MTGRTVVLKTPIVGHEGPITAITFREPTFDDVMALGDPYLVAYSPDGIPFVSERNEVIAEYASRLIDPKLSLVVTQCGLADSRKIRSAILDFFLRDGPEDEASKISPTSSSSTSAGPSIPSAA